MIILLLIQYFGQRPLSRKTCTSMSTTRWWNRDYVVDIEVHVFLDIELRVKLSYAFNIVPYGI